MQVKHIIYNIAISANCNYVCFDYATSSHLPAHLNREVTWQESLAGELS